MTAPFLRMKRQLVAAVTQPKPRVPEAGTLVWNWFVALSDARTYNMAGPNPIAFAEIEAYARLYRWPIDTRHIDLLRAMDAAYIAAAYAKGKDGLPRVNRSSDQPLTAAAFDAVFG